jgi:hypothetical protein
MLTFPRELGTYLGVKPLEAILVKLTRDPPR